MASRKARASACIVKGTIWFSSLLRTSSSTAWWDASKVRILWSRLANVVSVVVMTVLALPFVFGGLRSAGGGARLLVGLIMGLTYYVAGQVLTSGGEVYGVDPLVIAWAPTVLLVLVASFAFARIR